VFDKLFQEISMSGYSCPKCGNILGGPNSLAGQSETCPKCDNVCVVPAPLVPVVVPSMPVARPKPGFFSMTPTGMGGVLGLILGYPLSYFCQPEAMRMKIPLGDYIMSIDKVFSNKDLAETALAAWVGAVVVGAVIGLMFDRARKSRGNTQQ
jgi:hypothetical protein